MGLTTLLLMLFALVLVVWERPPDLIRVGAGYAAKIVCSNVFLANRDPFEVLKSDVQAPGHPLLKLMRVDLDRKLGTVRAGLLGFIGGGLAVARPDAGCAVMPDGRLDTARPVPRPKRLSYDDPTEWDAASALPAVQAVIADDTLAGPGMRAIVVVSGGRLAAERYAPGFDRNTPQLGWSMTKSVTAGLIGLLVKDGRLTLEQSAGLAGAARDAISVADLMSMTSGLHFDEGYGAVSDVTRMLYLEPDMAAFAGAEPRAHPIGEVWSYSSGSAVVVSRIFQNIVGSDSIHFVQSRLFEQLGMKSAVIETDETGTMVGSSYMYATPRDWARYGQLLVQDGVWKGREVLPRGYVAMMASPVAASGGEYGRGMVWRWVTHGDKPGENPDAALGIPADAFWMSGHDGQFAAIIPSRQLVIIRMGLTPARDQYMPEPLVHAVIEAAR